MPQELWEAISDTVSVVKILHEKCLQVKDLVLISLNSQVPCTSFMVANKR
jgi:hypothetical protein